MADGRKNNGGHKTNGGRKSKAEEQKLIERLTPLMPQAYKALKNALNDEEQWAVKLTFEYFFGKPKQQIEQTTVNYTPELSPEELAKFKDDFFNNY